MENLRRQPPRKARGPGLFGLLWMPVLCFAGGAFLFLTTPGQRIARGILRRAAAPESKAREPEPKIVIQEKIVEKRVEVPVPTPPPALPAGPSLGTRGDMTTMFSGMRLKSTLIPSKSDETATQERAEEDSYSVEVTVKIKMPEPASTIEKIRPLNPQIVNMLPGLPDMLKAGKVSGFFHYLYDLKQQSIQRDILRLDRTLTRHNFYDLETMLELEHPVSKQKVLFMQADMDVVSDGSDGDRMTSFDDYIFKSQHFQPSTSYGWAKLTDKVNPLVPQLEEELRLGLDKLKRGGLGRVDKAALESRSGDLPRIIADLKKRSYLIAQEDPFIVIPMSLRSYKGKNDWTPSIGDYAVVLVGNKIMPAIVGDYGPTTKVGEASLRIARELDATAGPYKRPISDLKATYLIFPDSAETPTKQPDYAAWHAKCGEYLTKIGGIGTDFPLHRWEDRLTPPAPPVPDPAASAVITPAVPPAPPVKPGPNASP